MNERYIWICRWEDFQHYAPDRDRPPAWIKTYTKQLSDDRYLDLTAAQRALLHDLRSDFARSHGRLTSEPRRLTQRLACRVTSDQLQALSDAGFIRFVSRTTLDTALEKLYASRARDRAHDLEVEVEVEQKQKQANAKAHPPDPPRPNGTQPTDIADTIDASLAEQAGTHHTHTTPRADQ